MCSAGMHVLITAPRPPLSPQGPIEPCSPSNPTECTGGGECFFEYSEEKRDVHDFGPCTTDGRAALLGTPGLSIEQINKYNETCGGPEPFQGSGSSTTLRH